MSISFNKLNTEYKCEQGYEFELISEDTEIKGVFLTILGDDSKTIKNHIIKLLDKSKMRAKMRERKDRDAITPTAEDVQFGIEAAACKLIGWRGIDGVDGNPFPWSPENALALCTVNKEIREQVNKEAAELGNFLKSK